MGLPAMRPIHVLLTSPPSGDMTPFARGDLRVSMHLWNGERGLPPLEGPLLGVACESWGGAAVGAS